MEILQWPGRHGLSHHRADSYTKKTKADKLSVFSFSKAGAPPNQSETDMGHILLFCSDRVTPSASDGRGGET